MKYLLLFILFLLLIKDGNGQYNDLNQDSLARLFNASASRGHIYTPKVKTAPDLTKVVISDMEWLVIERRNKLVTVELIDISIWNKTSAPIHNIVVSYEITRNGVPVDQNEFTVLESCKYCLTRIEPGKAKLFAVDGISRRPNERISFTIKDYQ